MQRGREIKKTIGELKNYSKRCSGVEKLTMNICVTNTDNVHLKCSHPHTANRKNNDLYLLCFKVLAWFDNIAGGAVMFMAKQTKMTCVFAFFCQPKDRWKPFSPWKYLPQLPNREKNVQKKMVTAATECTCQLSSSASDVMKAFTTFCVWGLKHW